MNAKLLSVVAATVLLCGALLAAMPSASDASPANAGATFFVPVTPCRVVDTRSGAGGKLLPGSVRRWQVSGTGAAFATQGGKSGGCGIPASAQAVELSASSVVPAGTGFLRAGPSGGAAPGATVLQYDSRGGTTNTGAVALHVGTAQGLTVTGNGAATHVVLDVIGYYASVAEHPAASSSIYVPFTGACRVFDTRIASADALQAGQPRTLQVVAEGPTFAAQGGQSGGCAIPSTATAIAATISVTSPTGTGFLRTWAAGTSRPTATAAQFTARTNTSNTATLSITSQSVQNLTIEAFGASTHAVIDVQGYELPAPRNLVKGSSVYVPMVPCRVADTRAGSGRLATGARRSILVAGSGPSFATQGGATSGCGVPVAATAVTVSISAADPTGSGYLRSGISGRQQQSTVLQYRARTGTTNTGAVSLTDRHIDLQASGGAPHVIVDVSGYYLPQPTPYIGGTTRLTNAASDSTAPKLSADGRYVTYASSDSPLATGDTKGVPDILLWDRNGATTTRIYASTYGASKPSISDDGSVVTFQSPDDTTPPTPGYLGYEGAFVWERSTGTATRISPTTADVDEPSISGDGHHIAYSLDTLPNQSDIFSWERTTGTTTRVSNGNGRSVYPALSTDGRYIAFQTNAINLVAGDTSKSEGVIVWDRATATNARVGTFPSRQDRPAISGDGRFVTYLVTLPALDQYNSHSSETEVALWDRAIDTTFRITAGTIGGTAAAPSISADGTLITFHSDAANLTPNDTNERRDVFLWDRSG